MLSVWSHVMARCEWEMFTSTADRCWQSAINHSTVPHTCFSVDAAWMLAKENSCRYPVSASVLVRLCNKLKMSQSTVTCFTFDLSPLRKIHSLELKTEIHTINCQTCWKHACIVLNNTYLISVERPNGLFHVACYYLGWGGKKHTCYAILAEQLWQFPEGTWVISTTT